MTGGRIEMGLLSFDPAAFHLKSFVLKGIVLKGIVLKGIVLKGIVLKGIVCKDIVLDEICSLLMPFIGLQVGLKGRVLVLVVFFPNLAMWWK